MVKKPDFSFDYDQGLLLRKREPGVCYGMCRRILEEFGTKVSWNDYTAAELLKKIETLVKGKNFLDRARDAQHRRRQSGRTTVRTLTENIIYIVGLNITEGKGYLTRYSLWSYVYIPFCKTASWNSNHAAMLVGIGGNILIFEPNWGGAVWQGQAIDRLTWRQLEEYLEYGYSSANKPIYVAEVET